MRPAVSWRASAGLAVLMGAAVGLQAIHARSGGPPAPAGDAILYVRSPDVVRRLVAPYDSVAADVYWIRAVLHYGSTRLSAATDKRYELLYPLLDVTTSLDPRFDAAYLFGAVFLAEPPPGGPGRPDLAMGLLEKGLTAQPEKWQFAQAIGFVNYWWLQDYDAAAAWFTRAARFPNAPEWLAPLAATTLAEGGRRDSSRLLWREIAAAAEHDWFRREALRRLQQLDAMDQIDELQRIVDAWRIRTGAPPASWEELHNQGLSGDTPADPAGTAYRLQSGIVGLDPESPLFPLPTQPMPPR